MGKTRSINIVRVLLALFFLFAAILPLVGMFGRLLDPSSVEVFYVPAVRDRVHQFHCHLADGDIHILVLRHGDVVGAVPHEDSLAKAPSPW